MRYMFARLRRGEEGFTLIELLVVVAIIALLSTFAAPKLFEAIKKSKAAPGQADLQTISSALDRYYMDNNTFPAALTAATSLKSGFLRSTTTFRNGYKQGYLYGTTAAKLGYVLIDLQGTTETSTITCGGTAYNVTTDPANGLSTIADLTDAHIIACVVPGASIVTH